MERDPRMDDRPRTVDEELDTASDDSFPASDPPSWRGGQTQDPAIIDPETFERERRAEERRVYGSGERHDGR